MRNIVGIPVHTYPPPPTHTHTQNPPHQISIENFDINIIDLFIKRWR